MSNQKPATLANDGVINAKAVAIMYHVCGTTFRL
jgi:hypothetical protein